MNRKIFSWAGIILAIVMTACSSNKYESEAWSVAKNAVTNQSELINFLERYKQGGDEKKYEAACFLISNLPGKYSITEDNKVVKDIDAIKADSLTVSLEYSFLLREKSPYLELYSFEQFLEYILPYRIANEPLEYYWKWNCGSYFHPDTLSDIKETADVINASIKLELSPDNYKNVVQSYSSIIRSRTGKCDDRTTLLVMSLRAAGIPAAYEFVPYWGSSNNGHSFASVILPDGTIYPLQNTDKVTGDGYLFRKVPKIYRKMYSRQETLDDNESAPELFSYGDLTDVTVLHHTGFHNVNLLLGDDINSSYYLSVFSPNGWIPVAKSASLNFSNVGTGTRLEKTEHIEALDLGNGIVYLPSVWKNGGVLPVGNPLIVSDDTVCEIQPDVLHYEKVVLKRKYPLNYRIVNFAKLMLLGVFEGANKADFSDAEELLLITDLPESKMQQVKVESDKTYRYVRYRRPKGTFSIAEFKLYASNGMELDFCPMACEGVSEEITNLVFDSDPLTYCQINKGVDMWVGADLHTPHRIGFIGFAPRNDDNSVVPDNRYELFYWQNGWNSLGSQISGCDSLVYDNVPQKSLLWLRNLTKGNEERPFMYRNGKQIWW